MMKKRSMLVTVFLMVCLVFTSIFCFPETASAKGIANARKAVKLAKKQVKGASVLEVDSEYEKGQLVYEIKMSKGKKEYNLVYRASDAKLVSYEWEIESWYIKRGKGKNISISKCRRLANKQVPGGRIISVSKKRSDGVQMYKVKMQKSTKKYEMKFHAKTGKLLEYEWELVKKASNQKNYIGEKKAKQIALAKAGGGTVALVEFDMDDGVPVYDVKVVKKNGMVYEIEIHAKTGKILDVDVEYGF
ncbi:PepSY domain-containing protein [Lachnospiraceae bacterium 29-84]